MNAQRLLIVDDEHLTTEMLSTFLRIIGHDAVEAFSCKQARDKLAYVSPDVILLDIMLPDQNGLELCRELRGDPTTSAPPLPGSCPRCSAWATRPCSCSSVPA